MSITRTLMLAGALAIGPTPAAPPTTVQPAATIALTAVDMDLVTGDGWFSRAWTKLKKWLIKVGTELAKPIRPPTIIEIVIDWLFDLNKEEGVVESFENEVTVVEHYDDEAAFNEGRISAMTESETGYVFTGSTGGGGDDNTCIEPSGCLMY